MEIKNIKQRLTKPQPLFIGEENAFRSAILIPLVEKEDGLHILFEVRASNMRKQPGDISFPGGQIDDTDQTVVDAALRETFEELGIEQSTVEVIQQLSPLIMSTGFVVYTIVGLIPHEEQYNLNKDEVGEVFTVPLRWFIDNEPYLHRVALTPRPEEDFPFDKIANGREYKWREQLMDEYFYDYNGHTIWGLTARILTYFINTLK